jgi:hypothetical protein
MLFNSGIFLLCIHSCVLLAVTASPATKLFTGRLLSSSLFSNTALHCPLTTTLLGCNVACASLHAWLLTDNVKWVRKIFSRVTKWMHAKMKWMQLPVLSMIAVWIILVRSSIAWLVLWCTGFGLEIMILFHTMDPDTFNALDRSSDGNMEFWTSLLRLLLFVFIGICCSLSAQHIDDTSGLSHEATQLLEGELEAIYGAVSRSLPCQKKGVCTSRFIRFLAHIWPKSIGLQFAFHSRILLLLFQRGVNLYFPYLTSVFLERIFQLKGDQKSTDAASQALYTYICFRVLETCLDVLQKSLWSRIV